MRAPPSDNWAPTLPADDRERYRAAWNDFTTCRDCKHWDVDDDENDGTGVCGLVRIASFMTPEDYTCEKFEPKTIR